MKKITLSIMMIFILAMVPNTGFASMSTFEGSIQGFTCVTEGTTCPVGKDDPLIQAERVFVLLTASNDYYFISNVQRAALARYINEDVRVSGKKDPRYQAIQAWRIEARNTGDWDSGYLETGDWKRAWGAPTLEEIARYPGKYW